MVFITPVKGKVNLSQPELSQLNQQHVSDSMGGRGKVYRANNPASKLSGVPGPDRSSSKVTSASKEKVAAPVHGDPDPSSSLSCSFQDNSTVKKKQASLILQSKYKDSNSSKSKQGSKKVAPSYQMPPNMFLTASNKSQLCQADSAEDDQCENIDIAECAAFISEKSLAPPTTNIISENVSGNETIVRIDDEQAVSDDVLIELCDSEDVLVELCDSEDVLVELCDTETDMKVSDPTTDNEEPENPVEIEETDAVDLESSNATTTSGQFVCDICKKIFSRLKCYGKHIVHCDKDLSCSNCGKNFKNKKTLRQHLLLIHVTTIKCGTCGESFTTEKKLARHMERIHSTVKIKCENCNNIFKNRKSLSVHKAKKVCPAMGGKETDEAKKNSEKNEEVKDQSKRKTYQCKHCPKSFGSDRGLRYHKQCHKIVAAQRDKQEDKNVDELCDLIVNSTESYGLEGVDFFVVNPDDASCITII